MNLIRNDGNGTGLYRRLVREQQGKPRRRAHTRQVLAVLLVVLLLLGIALPALALPSNTPKEEVVYIRLNQDGSVDAIYVVNIFELDEDGRIVDFGNYVSLRNLTASDEIQVQNETITIDTAAGRTYYEGTLDSDVIPWRFSIRYFLDGIAHTAEEIAGKTGALELKIAVRRNPDAVSSFFDHYALQVSFALDSARCKNIAADGATISNAGGKKQISFIVMPGTESDLSVTTDVTEFEMGGISVAGVTMRMEVALDPNALEAETQPLKDGVAQLDEGAQELKDGTADLKDAALALRDGTAELKDGTQELSSGAQELIDHTAEFTDGVSELHDGTQELSDGVGALKDGAGTLSDSTGSFSDGMKEADEGLGELADALKTLYEGAEDLYWGADSLWSGAHALSGGLASLTAQNAQLISASESIRSEMTVQNGAALTAAGLDGATFTFADSTAPTYYANQLGGAMEAMGGSAAEAVVAARIAAYSAELAAGDTTNLLALSELTELSLIGLIPSRYTAYAAAAATAAATGDPADLAAADAAGATLAATVYAYNRISAFSLSLRAGDPPDADALSFLSGVLSALAAPDPGAALDTLMQAVLSDPDEYAAAKAGVLDALAADPGVLTAMAARADEITAVWGIEEAAQGDLMGNPAFVSLYQLNSILDYCTGVIAYAQGAAELSSGAANVAGGVGSLAAGVSSLHRGIKKIYNGAVELKEGTAELASGAAELRDGTIELRDGVYTLYDGVIELQDGTAALLDGAVELQDGIVSFGDGVFDLRDGVATLFDGVATFRDGTITLHDGVVELADGTFEFREAIADIDTRIADAIQEKIDEMLGSDFSPVSFVSAHNLNVNSVQFVMQTEGIRIPDPPPDPAEPEAPVDSGSDANKTAEARITHFWQRLIALFRF